MASYRLIFGIIIGIILSFFSVFFFNMTGVITQIKQYVGSDTIKAASLLVGANFDFDMISFFTSNPTILGFFAPELLAWIFLGFLSGAIAKGTKRGVVTGLLIVVIDVLLWIIFSIVSGEDLMALFQDTQLSETLGGIISAILGAFIGGGLGGLISGPYEEFY
ncbi:MAG: hypothetical protein KGD58_06930 [Candidatus Lokiarchaeota archaeon]|nr:hypothetical protein [Candidatus Lokiarchaeota archaeon]